MSKQIEHKGTVKNIYNNRVDILIIQNSACSGCHAKKACSASDMAEKIIEVDYMCGDLKIGDEVIITAGSSMGWKAILYAFVLPFLILMATLVVSTVFLQDELFAGILSLIVLIPYYIVLFFFRDKMKEKFKFNIKTS